MFGFNNISIDKKSRFSFPAKYRDTFINSNENQIVITKDPQYPALKVYLGTEWDQIAKKLSSLQGLDPIVRNLQWTILGNACVCDFEPNGRMQVLISADLKKYAQIETSYVADKKNLESNPKFGKTISKSQNKYKLAL